MSKTVNNIYDDELNTLSAPKTNWMFVIAFIVSLLFFSWLGYLILTKEPPVSEKNFFDSIGYQTQPNL